MSVDADKATQVRGTTLIELIESITDEEAEKMPNLFRQLRKAYLEWKSTGQLPNREQWDPSES